MVPYKIDILTSKKLHVVKLNKYKIIKIINFKAVLI